MSYTDNVRFAQDIQSLINRGEVSGSTVAAHGNASHTATYITAADVTPYTLPTATGSVLGGIKLGTGLTDGGGGVINVTSSMVYPGAGIPLSTGSAWGTSITNNSANWNTAYGWGNHASANYITAAALSPYAPLASPTFTGTVTAPNVVYGTNGSGSNTASVSFNVYEIPMYKSGFWEINGASWTPTTDWYWGLTAAHTSNSGSYNYSMQLAGKGTGTGAGSGFYLRTISGGTPGSWLKIAPINNPAFTGTVTATGDIIAYSL